VSKQEAAKSFGQEFHAVRQALDDSLDEMRGISSGLVLPELENLSLEECLRKVVTLHGANSKAQIDQYYQGMPSNIPLPLKICAYRFIQEGLNNAHRHGEAKKCRLSAYVKDDELVISLKDNGIGFRKSKLKKGGPHLGLIGLKDRVQSLGGTFSINSELGVGTALKLVVSLADEIGIDDQL
jgi:signal transduction histidine kinase